MPAQPTPPLPGGSFKDMIKDHAREYLIAFSVFLALIQFLLPATLDLLFGAALVGCVYIGTRLGPKA